MSGGQALRRAAAHLDKTDVLGVLAEALPADVEPVLADQAPVVGADAAARPHTALSASSRCPKEPAAQLVTAHSSQRKLLVSEEPAARRHAGRVRAPLAAALAVRVVVAVPYLGEAHREGLRFNHRSRGPAQARRSAFSGCKPHQRSVKQMANASDVPSSAKEAQSLGREAGGLRRRCLSA